MESPSLIVQNFPALVATIPKMMAQAPARSKYCNCAYIHGLAGTGKTTLVKNMLSSLRKPYNVKVGGLSKWWYGYDYQRGTLIDDPGLFDMRFNADHIDAYVPIVYYVDTNMYCCPSLTASC